MTQPVPTYPLPPAGFQLKSRLSNPTPPELPARKPSNPLLPPLASTPTTPTTTTHHIPTATATSSTNHMLSPLQTTTSLISPSTTSSSVPMQISPTTSTTTSTTASASPFSTFFASSSSSTTSISTATITATTTSISESMSTSNSMSDVSMISNSIPSSTQTSATTTTHLTSSIHPAPTHHPPPVPPFKSHTSIATSTTTTSSTTTHPPLDLSSFDTLTTPSITELPLIRTAETALQRQQQDHLSDLFSIIVALERLETAFVRDAIPSADYKQACAKLLAQYRTLKDAVADVVPDVSQFMQDYNMQCRAAAARISAGVAADLGDHGASEGKELSVFHAVQHFITTMDSLKLNMKAVDELFPHLTDLMDSINKVSNLPPDHDSKVKVKHWLSLLSKLRAHDELSEEQVRQMSFDLDYAYSAFHKFVQGK